jgi:hypothetical protein
MPTILKTKNSVTTTVVPTTLQQGELAVNITDKKVWVGNAATTPVQLLGDGGSASFTSIAFGAGTVSAPSITFTGDTNTGIYSPAADTIAFTEGGVEAMRINASGNVGIGPAGTSTNTVSSGLAINNATAGNFPGLEIQTANTTRLFLNANNSESYISSPTNPLAFLVNSTERMRITSAGNVGINTSSPVSALQINGTATFSQGSDTRYGTLRFNSGTFTVASTETEMHIDAPFSYIALRTGTGGTATERMRILAGGVVGIGTSTPSNSSQLNVYSTASTSARIIMTGTTNMALLQTANDSGNFYFGMDNSTGGIFGVGNYTRLVWSDGAYPMAFATNGAERMRINASGQILMGTTGVVGGERLSVVSTGTITGWFQSTNTATTGLINIYSAVPSTAFNTNCAHFAGQTAGVNTWFLYANGTTSYVSDANLKKNIVTTRDGYLDDLAKLRVVKYQWKANSDESPTELGFIAQEVAEVFPNLVQDSIPVKKGGPTNKVILGSVLQPILIKSVQELYALVQEQQTLIENLTTRLNALEGK